MDSEQLVKANNIKREIDKLESFITNAEKVWKGKIIKRDTKYIFKSIGYGIVNSAEFVMDYKIKEEILDVLRRHLADLKERLENI